MEKPITLKSQPGVKRDGTVFEGDYYTDAQWCRFQRGLPRKMGGFRRVTNTVPDSARGINSFSSDNIQYIHLGHAGSFGQYRINSFGNFTTFFNRTPAGFTSQSDHLWQIDIYFDQGSGGVNQLVAHPGRNLNDIGSSTTSPIYLGLVTDSGALVEGSTLSVASELNNVSGGIVAIGPYLFTYGSNGKIAYSDINDFTAATEANVTQQKIVKGFPLRGSGAGPAGLFWSLDSLIRATFIQDATAPDFQFDTLATDISILSSQGIVEYDGIFYWPGVDRFLMFNGVVREIPNPLNQNWFFDNLNFQQRQKVFGFKVPRFGEIWWCYPRGDATECTHAVIFNLRENTWYDTALPSTGASPQYRTAGVYAKVYNKPFLVDDLVTGSGRTLWQHETGSDQVEGIQVSAIPSHFETHEFNLLEQGSNQAISLARIEPDLVQSGDMTVTVKGRNNARAAIQEETPLTLPDTSPEPTDETLKFKTTKRLMSIRWDSNTAGGDYEYGHTFMHIEPGDSRIES
jgi:hypothetical protein